MIRFDRLFKVDGKYFMASRIILLEKSSNPVALTVYLDGGHQVSITETADIQTFRDQYVKYLKRNGIMQWGDV